MVMTPEEKKTIRRKMTAVNRRLNAAHQRRRELQEACSHEDYDVVSRYNDHDGWSKVEISWYESRKCRICDKAMTILVGTEKPTF